MLACTLKAAREAFPLSKWPRKVRVGRSGAVREPASGAFDVTVAPGVGVEAAVDACPPGGCVLLLPGTHEGPLVLTASKSVHVFGRGRAMLRASEGSVLSSSATTSTVDGLIVRLGLGNDYDGCGVSISGGRLQLQACDIHACGICLKIGGGADPEVVSCR